jgi:hypothetical protein
MRTVKSHRFPCLAPVLALIIPLILSGTTHAVDRPWVDLQDPAAVVRYLEGRLSIQATTLNIGAADGYDIDFKHDFIMTADIASVEDPGSGIYTLHTDNGFFSIGGGTPLLTGRFSAVNLEDNFDGTAWLDAELTYLSGILMSGTIGSGLISGTFDLSSFTDFLSDFEGNYTNMKLGAVSPVPIPAAGWLLGSALLGLAGFRRFLNRV